MSGTSTTQDIFFASVLYYLYSAPSLLKIENDNHLATFTFDIPEEDNCILRDQFDKDELTLQAKSFAKAYWAITAILKQMRARGEQVWNAPKSEQWWERSRQAVLTRRK